MAVEKVREYLKEYHMEDRILEFDVSSATVELAAQAVGCEPERIAKTMSFLVNEEVILIVTAGTGAMYRKCDVDRCVQIILIFVRIPRSEKMLTNIRCMLEWFQ